MATHEAKFCHELANLEFVMLRCTELKPVIRRLHEYPHLVPQDFEGHIVKLPRGVFKCGNCLPRPR